jgi:hexosaminidase
LCVRVTFLLCSAFSHAAPGFLLDTANHFISVPAIKTLVDQLSLNRLNVLHWHLEDSYSFPFQSEHYRLLSSKGAWSPDAIYTHADVKSIAQYARMRGVRVMLELDVPGHTFSWGLGYPNVTVPCPARVTADIGVINSVGLDPTRNETYEMVRTLLDELAGLAPDEYFHLGGDEVQFECWNSSKVCWWACVCWCIYIYIFTCVCVDA